MAERRFRRKAEMALSLLPCAASRRWPLIVGEHAESFIVKDATGQALGYFYFEEEFGRRSADVRFKATAVIGCVSSETARSRMTHLRHPRPRGPKRTMAALGASVCE
jgi:hypothetical protein